METYSPEGSDDCRRRRRSRGGERGEWRKRKRGDGFWGPKPILLWPNSPFCGGPIAHLGARV